MGFVCSEFGSDRSPQGTGYTVQTQISCLRTRAGPHRRAAALIRFLCWKERVAQSQCCSTGFTGPEPVVSKIQVGCIV